MYLHYDEIYNNDDNINNNLSEKKQNIEIFINENPIKDKKKGFSYEDILTSLNMSVVDGKLQYINKNNKNNNTMNPIKKQVQMNSNNNNSMTNKNNMNMSLNTVIKELPRPFSLTKEQYQKIILFNRNKKIQFQKYINKIKPKQMFFSNNNNIITTNNKTSLLSNNNLNKLFKF